MNIGISVQPVNMAILLFLVERLEKFWTQNIKEISVIWEAVLVFGTIIMDSYKSDEAELMAKNIDEICSPMNSLGWASAGIYSFWDYYTKEVLYIGLASDLCIRFKQHNGLMPIAENACKVRQIQDYFSEHERLGYSILVQSPMSQPIVHRNKMLYRDLLEDNKGMPIQKYIGEEGLENIRQAEGQLIESYRLIMGDIPPWNKIGGDMFSRKYASENNYSYVVSAFSSGTPDNFLVARSTIRELAENNIYEWFESQLHGLRMMMLAMRMSFKEALDFQMRFNPYFEEQWNLIISVKYLDKELII